MVRLIFLLVGFNLALVTHAFASDPEAKAVLKLPSWCDRALTSQNVDATLDAVTARAKLSDLVDPNPETNLLFRFPLLGLSAEQRLLALINYAGVEENKYVGHIDEPVDIYHIFSTPSELNSYTAIVEQEKPIQHYVDALKNSIFQASRTIPVFIGPAATGKSLFISIFRKAYKWASTQEERFQYWSYDWVNLKSDYIDDSPIPQFKALMQDHIKGALDDSPFALLPVEVQSRILDMNTENLNQYKVGQAAPMEEPAWYNKAMKELIIQHYRDRLERPLTEEEVVAVLDHHVRLRRVIVGDNGSFPQLDTPTKDTKSSDLFGKADPQKLALLGATNPAIWDPGVIAQGHGFGLFVDELFRYPADVRDSLLGIAQDREFRFGQLPRTPVNVFISGASNVESLEDLENSPKSRAFLSRVERIRMPWLTKPHSVAKVIYEMAGHGNYTARKLAVEGAEKEVVSRDILIPRVAKGKAPVGTEKRYDVWFGQGESEVHQSPWVILFMGAVTSATRQTFDKEAVAGLGGQDVVNKPIYYDVVQRIRYQLGEDLGLGPSERRTLKVLAEHTNDGDFGLDQRDVKKWFDSVVSKARRSKNRSMSIVEAYSTFIEMMRNKGFNTKASSELRESWSLYADSIYNHIFVPRIQEDVFQSLTPDDEVAYLYRRVWEIYNTVSLEGDANATEYYDSERKRYISLEAEKKFLESLGVAYKEANGGAHLDDKSITSFLRYSDIDTAIEDPSMRDPALVKACKKLLLKKFFDDDAQSLVVSLADALVAGVRASGGTAVESDLLENLNSELSGVAGTYFKGMRNRGWTMSEAIDALDIAAGRVVIHNPPVEAKKEQE